MKWVCDWGYLCFCCRSVKSKSLLKFRKKAELCVGLERAQKSHLWHEESPSSSDTVLNCHFFSSLDCLPGIQKSWDTFYKLYFLGEQVSSLQWGGGGDNVGLQGLDWEGSRNYFLQRKVQFNLKDLYQGDHERMEQALKCHQLDRREEQRPINVANALPAWVSREQWPGHSWISIWHSSKGSKRQMCTLALKG